MIAEEREMQILSEVVQVFFTWMEDGEDVDDKRSALMALVAILAVKYSKKEELVFAGMLMHFTLDNWSTYIKKHKTKSFFSKLFGIEITTA